MEVENLETQLNTTRTYSYNQYTFHFQSLIFVLDRSIKFVPKQITFFESINRVKRYCSQLHTVEVPKLNLYVIHAKI